MTGDLNCCPECESCIIRPRVGGVGTPPTDDAAWYCQSCQTAFESPDTKSARRDDRPRNGLAHKLDNADPEEVSR